MEQLNSIEIEQIGGGIWQLAVIGFAITAIDAYDDFMEGWNSVNEFSCKYPG